MKIVEKYNELIEDLIYNYLCGTITQKDKDELFLWLAQDSENVRYFNQLSDIWLTTAVLQDGVKFDPEDAFNRVKSKVVDANSLVMNKKKWTIIFTWQKVAAIFLPLIILSSLFIWNLLFTKKSNTEAAAFTFAVPYGSKATVNLPDGSKVILNAGSKLICNDGFGKTNRKLELSGEGYFEVFHNKNLPFIVHAGNLYVKALGTAFNIKAYSEDSNIEAILIHGSIQINKQNSQDRDGNPLVLMPKQSLVYNKKTAHFQINIPVEKNKPINIQTTNVANIEILKTNVDPIIYTSWKEPAWMLHHILFSELAVELERKYDVKIHFENDTLKKLRFTGSLPDISLEQVLLAIKLTSPIDYKINGKEVLLYENQNLMSTYNKYYKDRDN